MKTRMVIMLIGLAIIFGLVFGFKAFKNYEIKKFLAKHKNPIIYVSATTASATYWQSQLQASGSTRTVKGVNVTTESAGMVETIYFTPGSDVTKGTLLVKLDIKPELAQLQSLKASAAFAKTTYERDLKQYKIGAVSQETLASDKSNYKTTAANVKQQQALIEQKIIRAPFSGRLGISAINPGQYLTPGDKIVTLETISPIYVDFYLPQSDLAKIKLGQEINVTLDAYRNKTFVGKVTTINPNVNSNSRNIEIEATLANKQKQLLPGMFTHVVLKLGTKQRHITVPHTAISFNSYGNIVYRLTKTNKKYRGQTVWQATQRFVTTGEVRNQQIAVLNGVNVGDTIVTAGQLKLQNNSLVVIKKQE